MDWNSAIEDDNRRMLKRIVALLFALAALAERLAGLPRPVRGFVLRILGSAETVARDFVFETTGDHGVPAPLPAYFPIPALQNWDSPADALRLAQSFRILAVLLDGLADHNCGSKRYIATAACSMMARLLAEISSGGGGFCATTQLAVERRDSS